MKIETKAIHSGDRKPDPDKPGAFIPVTTPVYTASSYIYESTAKLDPLSYFQLILKMAIF